MLPCALVRVDKAVDAVVESVVVAPVMVVASLVSDVTVLMLRPTRLTCVESETVLRDTAVDSVAEADTRLV